MAPPRKKQNTAPIWAVVPDKAAVVSDIISIPMDQQSVESIHCLTSLFESIEKDDVRKAVLPLCKFDSWININERMRDHLFAEQPKLRNLFAKGLKTYDEKLKNGRFFQIHFIANMIDFIIFHIETAAVDEPSPVVVAMLELSILLLSQLPTRRCVRPIFIDRLFEECVSGNSLYSDFINRICYFLHFGLNDFTAEPLSRVDMMATLETTRDQVRQLCWKQGMTEIGLSASATLFSSEDRIRNFLREIPENIVEDIIENIFFLNPKNITDTIRLAVFVNRLVDKYSSSDDKPLLPTEKDIATRPLVITKMGLQYLSFSDYFSRNSELYFAEAVHVIAGAVDDVVSRMQPEFSPTLGKCVFKGSARMGIPIEKSEIVLVKHGLISAASSTIRAEVTIDLKKVIPSVAAEWDSLKPNDCVFLVKSTGDAVEWIRGVTLNELVDVQGNTVGSFAAVVGDTRVMRLSLDPYQYSTDIGVNVDYSQANLVVRLRSSEIKSVLVNLRNLSREQSVKIPEWIHDILLGYGDPSACSVSTLNDVEDAGCDTPEVAVSEAMMKGLTIINGAPGTGKSKCISSILDAWVSEGKGRTLFVAKTSESMNSILDRLTQVPREYVVKLGGAPDDKYSRQMTINYILQQRMELLAKVKNIAISMGLEKHADDYAFNCDNAQQMLLNRVQPAIDQYTRLLEKSSGKEIEVLTQKIRDGYVRKQALMSLPGWAADITDAKELASALLNENPLEVILYPFRVYHSQIGISDSISPAYVLGIFDKLREVSAFEILRNLRDRSQYLTTRQARIVAVTSTALGNLREQLVSQGFRYDNVLVEDCGQMQDFETLSVLVAQKDSSTMERIVLVGDELQLPPVVTNRDLCDKNNFGQTLLARLIRLGCRKVTLRNQIRSPSFITNLWSSSYSDLVAAPVAEYAVPGMTYECQFIDISDSSGETQPMMHFYQNLGEAEYIVSLYMYLRLKGVDSSQISILAAYNGQRMLIQDVLKARCSQNALFGEPAAVTTIDQYQGQENDVILISLVRTESPGHNSDIRRLICGLSRTRVACYVFGRLSLYSAIQGEVGSVITKMATEREVKLSLESSSGRISVDSKEQMDQVLREEMRVQLGVA